MTKFHRNAAFSLIEVTIAIGIISFAFVAIFGMIPVGMNTFRKAMDTSVGSQIAQRVINDAQQSDFDQLIAGIPERYFDNQGSELAGGDANMVYKVRSRVINETEVPGGLEKNTSLATITVQVARNPGGPSPTMENGLWKETNSIPIITYSAYIARNSPKAAL